MLTIVEVTDKPCFICSSKEKTVIASFADKSFKGALCLAHVYEKLKPEVPRVAKTG